MTDEQMDVSAAEAVQGPAGDAEALAAAISARLHGCGTPIAVPAAAVLVSEATLAWDFAAQGVAEFEGPDGPRSARDPHLQAVKAWLARVCRERRLSCTYDARRRGYVFRRARPA